MPPILPRRAGVVVLAVAAAFTGCERPEQTTQQAPPPPAVTVRKPEQRALVDYREYTGQIEAVEKVDIRARVRGFLQTIHFKEGVEVKKGALLYEIDPREFEATLAKAKAEVERLQTQLELATTEATRAERLQANRATSLEDVQQKVAAREAARAALASAKAAVASAQLELSFTKIYAPIAGRVSKTLVTEGNLVGSAEPTLLTTLVQVDPIYVSFEVPEREFLEYQQKIRELGYPSAEQAQVPVEVGLATDADYPHKGVINFRDNRVDPGTGTILLRGTLPNPDRILVPGLYARVRVPIGKAQPRLLVPEVALAADQRGPYVLVVKDDNTVEARKVQTGPTVDGMIVILKGLKADDRVVVNGLQRARPGAPVTAELQAGAIGKSAPAVESSPSTK